MAKKDLVKMISIFPSGGAWGRVRGFRVPKTVGNFVSNLIIIYFYARERRDMYESRTERHRQENGLEERERRKE